MPMPDEPQLSRSYQAHFHERWNHLNDPHVRTLAWLLDAPDLLDPAAEPWKGRIASIGDVDEATRSWLGILDSAPDELHAYLGLQPFTRLGRYSEKLMAYYLEYRGVLMAHGIQVRGAKNETIGEFDFLVRQGDALLHWEFATKLYLLESSGRGHQADYFVGPNLADTLGAKVRKIMEQQLALSQHPAASLHLPQPIAAAQALVKGWLFYHGQTPVPVRPQGISGAHCRGFWCALDELDLVEKRYFQVLPRLSWLAPAKCKADTVIGAEELHHHLTQHFANNGSPVLVAVLEPQGDTMLEADRGFIVPDNWRSRAEARIRDTR